MSCAEWINHETDGGQCSRWGRYEPHGSCPIFATETADLRELRIANRRIEKLESQLARMKRCFSQIEILMAKYRIPEEE